MNLKRKKLKKKKSRFATLKPTHMEQGSEDSSQSQVSIKKVKKLKMKKLKTFTSSWLRIVEFGICEVFWYYNKKN